MKFKKWIVENKYGIPQMKIWSKETPIENEVSNFKKSNNIK